MADVADLFFLHLEEDEEEQEIDFGSEPLSPDPFPLSFKSSSMADVSDLFFLHLEEDEEEQEIDFGSEPLSPDPFPLSFKSSSMADVADLFFLHLEEDEEEQEIDLGSEPLSPDPFTFSTYTYPFFEEDNKILMQLVLSRPFHGSFDLSDRCPHPGTLDTSDFRATRYLGSELGLGFDIQEEDEEEEQDGIGGGLHIVGFETDTDWEAGLDPIDGETDFGLYWDSLRLEEERRDADDDFEWEEVDGLWDERDIHSMMVEEEESRNVDWEFLLPVNNVEMGLSIDIEEDGDFMDPSEYENLFGQLADDDSTIRGRPPAAKSVVDNLVSIVLTKEELEKDNGVCAVCTEEISLEEKVKQLPCLHHYHGECILPWLGMRNTCPICRFELPTDDAEYEAWKAQREGW